MIFLLGCLGSGQALAGCDLIKLGTLPVINDAAGIEVPGSINGHEIRVMVDTGAFASMVVEAAVRAAGLHPSQVPNGRLVGVGGEAAAEEVTVDDLKFGDFTVHKEILVVTPGDMGNVGLILGADVLSRLDVEIDLAKNLVIFWEPRNCEHTALAYWDSKNFMMADLKHRGGYINSNKFGLDVKIDGKDIPATLDTGSEVSTMSMETAHSLGFDERKSSPDPNDTVHGAFGELIPVYTATFDTFSLGPMTIKNAKFAVADITKPSERSEVGTRFLQKNDSLPKLTIGRDFLLANHVYIANSQGYLYFTYNGGPIFQRHN